MTADLNIAEVFYESGAIHYRYSRVLSTDGTQWTRHGLFVKYHETGVILCEGVYVHGQEHGQWRDFYENGQIAAEGIYVNGLEEGLWHFWDPSGKEDSAVLFRNGEEVAE